MQHIVEFNALGKMVRCETNDNGTHVELWFDEVQLLDASGQCFEWEPVGHLHGAVREAAIAKQLKQYAENQLASLLVEIPNLYRRIGELEDSL